VLHQNLLLGTGAGGAFAIDSRTGTLRWKIRSTGTATEPVLYPRENAVVFFDKKRLFVVDVETGKVLRRTAHGFGTEPRFIRSMGGKFVVAMGDINAVLYNIETGEYVTALPKPTAEFPSVNFVVKQHPADFGAPNAGGDLTRQLQDGWDKISRDGEKSQADQIGITRLKSFLAVDSSAVYGEKSAGDSWKLWCVNPTTGAVQQITASGSQADASSALGLAYFVHNTKLRAEALPRDCRQIPPSTNGSAGL
jgi:hypothetical protein